MNRHALLLLVAVMTLGPGCRSKQGAEPGAETTPSAAPASAAPLTKGKGDGSGKGQGQGKGDGSGKGDGTGRGDTARRWDGGGQGDGNGPGQRRFRQAIVYADGTPLAVVRFGELPPALKSAWDERPTSEGGVNRVRQFRLVDYFAALGVDVAKLKAAHFYGGRGRVGIVTGEELLKWRDQARFSFTRSESGKARLHWPRDIAVTDKIDMMNDVALYLDKPAPTWNQTTWNLELGGQPITGVPYATTEVGGGTRVYVDGRLARTLRPKALGPPSGDPPRWSLASQLAGAGVVLDQVQAVDLIAGEVLAKRLDREAARTATFEMVEHSEGRLTVYPGPTPLRPPPSGEGNGPANAEAIVVYVKATPVDPKDR